MREIINTRVSLTAKGGRAWFEGVKLDSGGFKRDSKYSMKVTNDEISLILDRKGKRKVSGKRRNGESVAIIDLCGKWLLDIFEVDELITARVFDGKITIRRHAEGMAKRERDYRLLNNETLHEGALCYGIGVSAHAINKAMEDSNINSKVSLIMEREAKYLQAAKKNNVTLSEDSLVIQGNLEDCDTRDLSSLDILSLSLPCTGHSPAGKTSNKIKKAEDHSKDSTAIFGAIKVIYKTNPSIIISENVIQARTSATYVLFKSELRRLGYRVFEINLDETHSNSLEKRKRYWFVAISEKMANGFNFDNIKDFLPKREFNNIGELLDKNEDRFFSGEYFQKREVENLKKGRGFKRNFVSDECELVGVIPRNYSKRQISNPHYQDGISGDIRLFNPVEHARIKGIPADLVRGISDTVAHEGLGQSILYSHAYVIVRKICEHILKLREENNIKMVA
jgi:DNA (cytosine-5)-methyltransferase 1